MVNEYKRRGNSTNFDGKLHFSGGKEHWAWIIFNIHCSVSDKLVVNLSQKSSQHSVVWFHKYDWVDETSIIVTKTIFLGEVGFHFNLQIDFISWWQICSRAWLFYQTRPWLCVGVVQQRTLITKVVVKCFFILLIATFEGR